MPTNGGSRSFTLGLLVASLLLAPTASAAAGGQGARRDFLLKIPKGSITLRGGVTFASADSDIYDFTIDRLTVDRNDFNAPTLGLDVAAVLTPRLDVVFGIEYSRTEVPSELRDYVDQDGLPIVQQTRLTQLPITGSLRYYFIPRGRAVGSYTWVPRRFALYAGAGVGAVRYDFQQSGDFVDFLDLAIFSDTFVSSGWAPTLHVSTGADVKLTPRLFLAFDLRYAWADSELDSDFLGFEPIDLSGLRTTTGISFLF